MNISETNCSSCGACANVCRKDAITMQLDANGFYRPVVDSEKCVQCGMCEKNCPWINAVKNPNTSRDVPWTIAAYVKDESIRMESSSGGIFSILAEKFLDEGGVVVGVAQLSSIEFGHIIVENKADLAKLRGSKYVQADVGTIYKKVHSLLNAGQKVLFSGTPCQVAALYAVLGRNAASVDLTTIDLVCHGTPSVKVFEKYVAEIEKGKSVQVLSTRFRDKRKGWRLFSMTSLLKKKSGDYFEISETLHKNKFMRVFLQNICLNTSCSDCKYGKLPRVADVTLGDYWNIAQAHPKIDNDSGISVVLLNTEHGKALFDTVIDDVVFCESAVDKAIARNRCIVSSYKPHPKRSEFFAHLDEYTIDELIKKYCPYPSFGNNLYNRVRGILGRVKRMIVG